MDPVIYKLVPIELVIFKLVPMELVIQKLVPIITSRTTLAKNDATIRPTAQKVIIKEKK